MLNPRVICLVIGPLIILLAVALLLPLFASLIAKSGEATAFFLSAVFTVAVGGLLTIIGIGAKAAPNLREGLLIVAGVPAIISMFSALPYFFSEINLSFTDAIFEAVSGATGTGSTILTGIDFMPKGILLWRSTTQWVGGLGFTILAVIILPMLNVGGLQLLRIEFGDRVEKYAPRVANMGAWIVAIYIILTATCFLLYAAFGMSTFDALNHAFTTVATGGFSTHDASFGFFAANHNLMGIALLFMVLSAIPYPLLVQAIQGKLLFIVRDNQVIFFLLALVALCLLQLLWLFSNDRLPDEASVIATVFNVTSIFSSTGYATGDYSLGGGFAFFFFLGLMMVGGCTGSTAGGFKVYRLLIFIRGIGVHFRQIFNPNGIFIARFNGQRIPNHVLIDVVIYLMIFMSTIGVFSIAFSLLGMDVESAFSTSVATVANIGPALGEHVGPASTYAEIGNTAKWLMITAMLLGRVEIIAFLILFTRDFWRN